jgi:LysR family transcriptional regulator for bpeEF and oprC
MRFFCRVSESGSFAAAAQTFDVVPSAMSKVLSGLEQELGFRLINRSTRGLSLTDEGTAYYEQCRQILQDIEEAEGLGRSGQASARGTLRIGMHPALRFALMTALGGFLDQQPGVKLETVITNSPSAIANEGLDVVLHIGPLADSNLRARALGWTRSLVCASPAYLAAWGEPRHPGELSRHRAVIYARRDEEPNTRWAFARGDENCEVDVPVRLVSRDGVGLIEAALGGCGIARPFDLAVRHWLGTGQLVELLRDWSAERQPASAVLPAQGRSTAKTRLFLDHVAALLAEPLKP